ncbi:MAG: flavin reductase [Chloroflexota bacterium]
MIKSLPSMKPIPVTQLLIRPYSLWENQWLLLTSGDFSSGQFNCMTVAWGSLGQIWGRPFAQIVVRPQRYTYQFTEKFPTFTLCAFPKTFKQALNYLGNHSGRDSDKLSAAGLTPVAASSVAAPVYAEAELVLECRKIYWQDIDPSHFTDQELDRHYPEKDYHRSYFGEILAVFGTKPYLA